MRDLKFTRLSRPDDDYYLGRTILESHDANSLLNSTQCVVTLSLHLQRKDILVAKSCFCSHMKSMHCLISDLRRPRTLIQALEAQILARL